MEDAKALRNDLSAAASYFDNVAAGRGRDLTEVQARSLAAVARGALDRLSKSEKILDAADRLRERVVEDSEIRGSGGGPINRQLIDALKNYEIVRTELV